MSASSDKPLTYRQEVFCQALASGKTGAEAVEIAGFENKNPNAAAVHASKLKAKPYIQRRLQEIASETPGVASRVEIQRRWTDWMIDADMDMSHRLKASELLAKSQGLFTQKVDVDVKVERIDPVESLAEKLDVILHEPLLLESGDDDDP